jgi:hypothetical protein
MKMSGNAFIYRMPAGIPGAVTRAEHTTIEPGIFDASYPVTVFGVPVKIVSGKVRPIASGDTLASVMAQGLGGFLVRPYPTQYTSNEALAAGTPNVASIADVMKRGYMMVKVNASLPAAVPAKGGVVYCRKTDPGASEDLIGGVESDADSAKCEAIPNCFFTGAMDSDGNCEIAFNI